MKPRRPSTRETALVLGEDLEQRVARAARRLGREPAEFIVNCLERRCAQVLTPRLHARDAASLDRQVRDEVEHRDTSEVRWAIRPSETRVLRIMEELTHVSSDWHPIAPVLKREAWLHIC